MTIELALIIAVLALTGIPAAAALARIADVLADQRDDIDLRALLGTGKGHVRLLSPVPADDGTGDGGTGT